MKILVVSVSEWKISLNNSRSFGMQRFQMEANHTKETVSLR